MINYIISSTVCIGIILLFYHLVLEKEKMYNFNRAFLIFGLIFSFTVTFIPIGIFDANVFSIDFIQKINIQTTESFTALGEQITSNSITSENKTQTVETVEESSSYSFLITIAFFLYSAIVLILLFRFAWKFYSISKKALTNPTITFQAHKVVLIEEQVVPHTFFNTIFVNRKQYQKGAIGEEILFHELTHAKHKHTLDILFIEILKIVFWFNPLLYFYKRTTLMNHEFIADQAVILKGTPVQKYQTLLLDHMHAKPTYSLSNTFNFQITKKRFQMMTKTSTRTRSYIKLLAVIPLFISLGILLGCESLEIQDKVAPKNVKIEIMNSGMVLLNGERMHKSVLEDSLSKIVTGKKLLFELHIQPDTPVGDVTDVQSMIREFGAQRVNYTIEEEKASDSLSDYELKQLKQKFQYATSKYFEMEVTESNLNSLNEQYDIVMKWHSALTKAQEINSSSSVVPPPPPVPLSPENRIKKNL